MPMHEIMLPENFHTVFTVLSMACNPDMDISWVTQSAKLPKLMGFDFVCSMDHWMRNLIDETTQTLFLLEQSEGGRDQFGRRFQTFSMYELLTAGGQTRYITVRMRQLEQKRADVLIGLLEPDRCHVAQDRGGKCQQQSRCDSSALQAVDAICQVMDIAHTPISAACTAIAPVNVLNTRIQQRCDNEMLVGLIGRMSDMPIHDETWSDSEVGDDMCFDLWLPCNYREEICIKEFYVHTERPQTGDILLHIRVRNEGSGHRVVMDSVLCEGSVQDSTGSAYELFCSVTQRRLRALAFCMVFHRRLGQHSCFGSMPIDTMQATMHSHAWRFFS